MSHFRINAPPLPPMNTGDTIARSVFAVIAQGGTMTGDDLKRLVEFAHPNGLGRTFEAMLILARQAVRTSALEVIPIKAPPAPPPPPPPKVIEVRKEVEKLSDKRVTEVVDQILGDINAAALVARQEKRGFGVRDIRAIIERGLR